MVFVTIKVRLAQTAILSAYIKEIGYFWGGYLYRLGLKRVTVLGERPLSRERVLIDGVIPTSSKRAWAALNVSRDDAFLIAADRIADAD